MPLMNAGAINRPVSPFDRPNPNSRVFPYGYDWNPFDKLVVDVSGGGQDQMQDGAPNELINFLSQVEADRRRRQQEAAQAAPSIQTMPQWAQNLNPDDFTGTTRDMLMKARAQMNGEQVPNAAAKGDMQPMPVDTVNRASKVDQLLPDMVPSAQQGYAPEAPGNGAPGGFSGGYGAATGLDRPMPLPEQNIAPAASQAQETPNMMQALGPHVGGAGGSFIDMQRRFRQTGALPDARGMPSGGGGQPQLRGDSGGDDLAWAPGDAPSERNTAARAAVAGGQGGGFFGGGDSGPGMGYIIGGIGAMLQEAGGTPGAVNDYVTRYQAHHLKQQEKAQELARFNGTVKAALDMGIDPDYVMTMAETGDMKEIVKAIHEERKFKREEGKPGAPKIATFSPPSGGPSQSIDLGSKDGRTLAQQLMAQGWNEVRTPAVQVNMGDANIPEKLLQAGIDSSSKADTLDNQVNELRMFRDQVMQTPTGWSESLTFPARRALLSLGWINDENLSGQELVTAMQNQQALRLRNPESGFGLTGNTSDRDVRFLKDTVAGLEKTPQGNVAMLTVMMAKQRREAQLERARSEYIFENKSLQGWGEARKQFIEATPLFTEEEQQMLAGLKQQAQPGQSQPEQDIGKPPPGIPPEEWNAMTPEDRALWQN